MRRYDVIWEAGGLYRTTCLHCHQPFSTKRQDTKYCGANCRQAAHRQTAKIAVMGRTAADLIEKLKALRYDKNEDLANAAHDALYEVSEALPTGMSRINLEIET